MNKHQDSQPSLLVDVLLGLAAVTLVVLSILYYQERTIFTDTAYYAYTLTETGSWVVPTNRYISVLSQILPQAAVQLKASLSTVLIVYSLNFILLPIACAAICRFGFRQQAVALSILLFYVLMSSALFYYPVSEFQMGMCLLFLYHAYTIHYFSTSTARHWLFLIVQLLLLTTIIFSHPLSLYVWLAWLFGLLLLFPPARKRILWISVLLAVAAAWARDYFWPSIVGEANYDEVKKQSLYQFLKHPFEGFDTRLSLSFADWLRTDYFVLVSLWCLIIILLLTLKKRLAAGYFVLVTLCFIAIVMVTFGNSSYNQYIEHMLQPLPFFVALFSGYLCLYFYHNKNTRTITLSVLLLIFVVSFAKINSGHKYFSERLAWYQRYLQFMEAHNIYNGALDPKYILFENIDYYWADVPESRLLSSLAGPDKTRTIKLSWDRAHIKNDTSKGSLNQTQYYLQCSYPYQILDEVAQAEVLEQLKNPQQ